MLFAYVLAFAVPKFSHLFTTVSSFTASLSYLRGLWSGLDYLDTSLPSLYSFSLLRTTVDSTLLYKTLTVFYPSTLSNAVTAALVGSLLHEITKTWARLVSLPATC